MRTCGQGEATDAGGNGGHRIDRHLVVELRGFVHLKDVRRDRSLHCQLRHGPNPISSVHVRAGKGRPLLCIKWKTH